MYERTFILKNENIHFKSVPKVWLRTKIKILERNQNFVCRVLCLSEYYLIKFLYGLYMILKIIPWSVDDTKTKADPPSIQTLFHTLKIYIK